MMDEEHVLWQVGAFTSRIVRFENGLPIREPVEPYFRYYCTCGAVGGKTVTREQSLHKFNTHASSKES